MNHSNQHQQSQQSQQIHVNIEQMRKKTEIENNLLNKINADLEECYNDLNWIKTNCVVETNMDNLEMSFELASSSLHTLNKICQNILVDEGTVKDFETNLFEKVSQVWSVFQYFYLKKKDFMGMNLTGLIQGKMETGLIFRNSMEKISPTQIQKTFPELIYYINTNMTNYIMYKIKSTSSEYNSLWNKYKLDEYSNWYVICNLDTKKYFLLFEKSV